MLAIALQHELGKSKVPKVVASGSGYAAQKIIDLAHENNITVQKDEHLATMLSDVEVNSFVPEDLYEAVAKVLAFIYRVEGKI